MATETPGSASTCVGPDGSAIGLPQLCFDWFPNQIFWLIVTLIVIYFVLTRVALPRIAAVLSERAGTISNDLAAAEDLKAKAAEAEKAYEKALADARAEAQKIISAAKAEMQEEVDAAMARADSEIAEKVEQSQQAIAEIRAGALESIREVAQDTAGAVLEVMGTEAEQAEIERAVAARMEG
ncbi:F0F1 ATP synthase subunit B' [Rhodosalinus halophilus]|uniref:ATP synthase subunit b n=1 Tax=Rhodosalinus halophilus TaxID=2259333 RepID=A0A365UAP3_9RHOB|nr:F0F1 ATP synthase subunit B' [Rhodosalinus halophilus]RBI86214.1 F0F1 ATP synthase subunit B' [Rhodosalinus halophilus]